MPPMTTSGKPPAMKAKKVDDRPVLYPKIKVEICTNLPVEIETVLTKSPPITADRAKEILGWETAKNKTDSLLVDEEGALIKCVNITHNRLLRLAHCRKIAQEILNRHYRLNGESLIVGDRGEGLSLQHRLIGLVLAAQMWAKDPKWKKFWAEEPTLDSFLVFGIDESSETIRTIDNTMARDFADVLYTSGLFADLQANERPKLVKNLEYAIQYCWFRSIAWDTEYGKQNTHSELLEWQERHPKIVEAAKHVWEEDGKGEGRISYYLPLGYATAFLYLAAAGKTDGANYHAKDREERSGERHIDFSLWDKAEEFFVLLADGSSPDIKPIRDALRPVGGVRNKLVWGSMFGPGGGSRQERFAMLTKGWLAFANGVKIPKLPTDGAPEEGHPLHLGYELMYHDDNRFETAVLLESPPLGGIDFRGRMEEEVDEEREAGDEPPPPAPEEAKARQKKIDEDKLAKKREADKKKLTEVRSDLGREIRILREQHPGYVLLHLRGANVVAWGNDAEIVGKLFKLKPDSMDGITRVSFPGNKLEANIRALIKAGHKVATCRQKGAETEVTPVEK